MPFADFVVADRAAIGRRDSLASAIGVDDKEERRENRRDQMRLFYSRKLRTLHTDRRDGEDFITSSELRCQ